MIRYDFTCTYCNFKWDSVSTPANVYKKSCPKCSDTKLIVREWNRSRIDYYYGAPPFPEPEESDANESDLMGIDESFNPFDYGAID